MIFITIPRKNVIPDASLEGFKGFRFSWDCIFKVIKRKVKLKGKMQCETASLWHQKCTLDLLCKKKPLCETKKLVVCFNQGDCFC